MEEEVPEKRPKGDTRRFLAWMLLMNIVMLIMFVVIGYLYINHVDRKRAADERDNDREWCELIVLYDDYFQKNPPVVERDPTGLLQQQARYMHRRRQTLGC